MYVCIHAYMYIYINSTELKAALDLVYGERAAVFKYDRLFAEDRDYSQNEFAEEFKAQVCVCV